MGPTLNGPFREVVDKTIDIGEWSMCGGGQLGRSYFIILISLHRGKINCFLLDHEKKRVRFIIARGPVIIDAIRI